jgi:hypothetical protein
VEKGWELVELHPGESVSFQGFGIDRGHMGRSFDLVFPTQTAFPEVSGLKIERDVIEFSPDQAVSVIAIIAPEVRQKAKELGLVERRKIW